MMILLGGEVIIKHSRVADARDRRKKKSLTFLLVVLSLLDEGIPLWSVYFSHSKNSLSIVERF